MSKHAVLIQAHTQPKLTSALIRKIQDPDFYFFIHVDAKSTCYEEYKKMENKNVKVLSERFNVNWGAYEQIVLTIVLIKEAKSTGIDFDYYHLISGQDVVLKTSEEIKSFFSKNEYVGYMELAHEQECSDRYMLYHLNGVVNLKTKFGGILEYYFVKLQQCKLFFVPRRNLGYKAYKGSNWWTLNKVVIDYVLSFLKNNPSYIKRFRFTSCCDEVFFHTIVFNSPFKDRIYLSDLRYVDWKKRNVNDVLPHILKKIDYDEILNSGCLFARKIDENISRDLLEIIYGKFI